MYNLDKLYISYFIMGFVMEYTTIPERYFFLNFYSVSVLTVLNMILNISWGLRPLVAMFISANNRNIHIIGVTAISFWWLLVWSLSIGVHTGFIIFMLCLVEFTTTIVYYTLDTYTSNLEQANIYKCYRYRLLGSFIGSLIGAKLYVEVNIIAVFFTQGIFVFCLTILITQLNEYVSLSRGEEEQEEPKNLTNKELKYIIISTIIPTSFVMMDYYAISQLRIGPVKQSYIDLIGGLFGLLGTYQFIKTNRVFLLNSFSIFSVSFIVCIIVDRVYVSFYDVYFLIFKSSMLMFSQTTTETYIMKTVFDNYKGDTVNISFYTTMPYVSAAIGTFFSSILTWYFEIDHDNFYYVIHFSLTCFVFSVIPGFFIPKQDK